MMNSFYQNSIARWFFLLLAAAIGFLFWRVIEPFAIVLVTAAVVSVVVSPLEAKIHSIIKWPKLSAFITTVFVFVALAVPLAILTIVMAEQALTIVNNTIGNP